MSGCPIRCARVSVCGVRSGRRARRAEIDQALVSLAGSAILETRGQKATQQLRSGLNAIFGVHLAAATKPLRDREVQPLIDAVVRAEPSKSIENLLLWWRPQSEAVRCVAHRGAALGQSQPSVALGVAADEGGLADTESLGLPYQSAEVW